MFAISQGDTCCVSSQVVEKARVEPFACWTTSTTDENDSRCHHRVHLHCTEPKTGAAGGVFTLGFVKKEPVSSVHWHESPQTARARFDPGSGCLATTLREWPGVDRAIQVESVQQLKFAARFLVCS